MTIYIAKHEGGRPQIIRITGGESVTLKPGRSLPVEPDPDIDEEMRSHYAARGVTFSAKPTDQITGKPLSGARKAAAEKAEAGKAAAEKAEAEKKAAAEKAAAIAKAEADVLEARALRDASGDDLAAKADAEKMLSAAEQALADLKA